MDINKVTAVYFVGAGGIGMSALIRYFLAKGKRVGGYDKTPSDLTEELKKEGAGIHYEDNVALIGEAFKSPDDTLVVYTPAVPESHTELTYFRAHGFEVMKRARVLGEITKSSRGLCVAGTHGKTTTSSMLAHLLKQSPVDCNAFLGGILKNYESNLMLSDTSDFTVIEADDGHNHRSIPLDQSSNGNRNRDPNNFHSSSHVVVLLHRVCVVFLSGNTSRLYLPRSASRGERQSG